MGRRRLRLGPRSRGYQRLVQHRLRWLPRRFQCHRRPRPPRVLRWRRL